MRCTWILMGLALMLACSKKPVEPGCDCLGAPGQVLTDALATARPAGITVLDPEHLKQGWVLLHAIYCNADFVNGKVAAGDTVYISGSVRAPCNYNDFNFTSRIEVTAIRKKYD